MSGPNYIEHALSDNGIIELRCLGPNTLTGIFDDAEALRQAAQLANRTHNVFSSLNRPSGRPATNTLDTGGGALGNADIERITRIPFDLDPARPTGTNSTSAEMEAGRVQAYALMSYLNSWGWPEPLLACSGNGYHLMYRVKLPADQATADALRIIYLALQSRYTNSQVSFDTSVRNPARIFRLYGTTNRKGPDSAERPQRQSSCYVPSRWDCVARGRFRALAEALTPKPIRAPRHRGPIALVGNAVTTPRSMWWRCFDPMARMLARFPPVCMASDARGRASTPAHRLAMAAIRLSGKRTATMANGLDSTASTHTATAGRCSTLYAPWAMRISSVALL
jgi:hypothetical protein